MPIRNEGRFIERSLGAVLTQDYPAERMEVLIADGMSTDGTRDVVCRMLAQHPHIAVKLLDNPIQIVSTGLNIALSEARGEIIIRVDGHCEVARDYIWCCVAHLNQKPVDGVGGPIDTISHSALSQAIAVAMSSVFGVGGSAFRTVKDKEMLTDTVAFPAYRRSAIAHAGPYDEELVRNQDDEYNYRLRELGHKILLAPDVHARYYSRSSIRKLARQYFQYGLWKVRVMQKHPLQMRPRQFVPPAFVTALFGGALLAPFIKPIRFLWLLMLGLYTTANVGASVLTARKHGWQYLRWLPVTFGTLHLSYGLGFLAGLVKFARRWGDKTTYATATYPFESAPQPATASAPTESVLAAQPVETLTKVSVIVPAYNEAAGVAHTAQALRPVLAQMRQQYDLEIIFVNDGSKDNTLEQLKAFFADDPSVRIVSHDTNRGLGAALRTGFAHARGDVIITTDFDGTYSFDLIPDLLNRLDKDQVDIVTASPYHPDGGKVEGVPPYRIVFSYGASMLYRVLVAWRIYTWTALFRAYRRSVVKNIEFESDTFLAGTELLVKALRAGYTASEFPATLRIRTYGQSSMKVARTVRAHLVFQSHILGSKLVNLASESVDLVLRKA
ncbi:MAG: glycosyltransferase [Anaerolineae bacterium]|nr:glycosyltransferase [Anaerolineae bacterium]